MLCGEVNRVSPVWGPWRATGRLQTTHTTQLINYQQIIYTRKSYSQSFARFCKILWDIVYSKYIYLVMLVLVFGPSGQSQFWEFPEIQALVYCVPTHRRATKNPKTLEAMKSPVGSQIKLLNNSCGTMQFPKELLICILFRAAVQFWFAAILEEVVNEWREWRRASSCCFFWDESWVSSSLMALKYLKRLILLWSLIFIVRFSSRSWSIFVLKR